MRETCSGLTLAFYRTVEHVPLATNDHEKERAGKYAIRRGWRRTTIYARYTVNIAALDLTRLRRVRNLSISHAGFFLVIPSLPPLKFILRAFRPNTTRQTKTNIACCYTGKVRIRVYKYHTSLFTRETTRKKKEEEERKHTQEKGRVKHWKRDNGGDLIETMRCANCTR